MLFPKEVKIIQHDPNQILGGLYPQEEVYIEKAGEKRRREFTAGRILARQLLNEFGICDFPVLMGEGRQPLWPDHMIGSIAHSQNACVVALAQRGSINSLGIDVEKIGQVKKHIWESICTPEELKWLNQLPLDQGEEFATVIFGAKESLYKCFYPLTKQWIGFKDVSININSESSSFVARFNVDVGDVVQKGKTVGGRYLFKAPYVLTGISL